MKMEKEEIIQSYYNEHLNIISEIEKKVGIFLVWHCDKKGTLVSCVVGKMLEVCIDCQDNLEKRELLIDFYQNLLNKFKG
jgi:hypothetical protein